MLNNSRSGSLFSKSTPVLDAGRETNNVSRRLHDRKVKAMRKKKRMRAFKAVIKELAC